MKSKKLLASFLTVVSLLQFSMFTPKEVKAFSPTTTGTQTTSSYMNTNDNLIADYNSMFTDGSKVDTSYTNGLTGKFSFDNWKTINEVTGKLYSSGGLSGGYGGYRQGGMITQNGQAQIPLSDLGISASTTDVTISFWYKWDGTWNVMPIGFNNLDLFICNGFFGINTANNDVYGINNPFKIGQYTHVAIHLKTGSAANSELYINGVKMQMSQKQDWTVDSSIGYGTSSYMAINGWQNSTSYRTNGSWIDEVYVWNRALTSTEVSNVMQGYNHTYSYYKDMAFRMNFDGNIVQNDVNNLVYPSASNGYVAGKKKAGLRLEGDAVYVPPADNWITSSDQNLTVSFWYLSDSSVRKEKTMLGFNNGFALFESPNGFGVNTGNGEIWGIPNPFSATVWHHISITITKGDVTKTVLYLDGQKQNCSYVAGSGTNQSLINFDQGSMRVGVNRGGTWDYAPYGTSTIDEIMIWKRALTGDEAKSIYESTGPDSGGWGWSNYWETFSYDDIGGNTGLKVQYDSTLGMNYMHLTGNDRGVVGTGKVSDSGAQMRVDNLKANTWYTASAYVKADNATSWGNGLFFITNSGNNSHLNAGNIDNVDISTQWTRNSVAFYTGSNTSIYWRVTKGDHKWLDVAALKLEEGKNATPFISYNEQKTYAYGLMDNMLSPHDSNMYSGTSALPSPTSLTNNWWYFNYLGTGSSYSLGTGGRLGYNYYHITGSGSSDSGLALRVNNVEPNTDYTVGGWYRIGTSTSNGNGRLCIVNSADNGILGAFNPQSGATTNGNWEYITGTFNSGTNTAVSIRVTRGDASYVDFTNITMQFGSTLPSSNGGYSGTITPQTVTFTPAGNVVNHHTPDGASSSRTATISDSYTDGQWHDNNTQFSYPPSVSKSYFDSASGQTFNVTLPATGISQINSTTQSYTTTVYQNQSTWIYQTNLGDYKHYDPYNHTSLGYQSDNSSYYYGGSYSYGSSPRPPQDYYGPVSDQGYTWSHVSSEWADSAALYWSPYNIKIPGTKWQSDRGSGYVYNSYRKGVNVTYRRYGTTSVPVTQTNYKTVYMYQSNYSASINLPDTVNHYEDYSVTTRWKIDVNYSGPIYPTNIHANSVSFYSMSGTAISSSVQAGQDIKARVSYINNGNYDINTPFDINLYDESGKLVGGSIVTSSVPKNVTQTIDIVFTYPTSGTHTLTAKIDDNDSVDEADENDNSVSNSITFYIQNLACNYLQIVGTADDVAKSSLSIGQTYRAKIGLVNTGTTNIGAFTIGLYGVQTPPSEQTVAFPDPTTKLGSNYSVNGVNASDGLGAGFSQGYAYITFVANTTDTKGYTAWVDNGQIIPESNEWDNLKSLALNTLAINSKANSINITDMSGTTVSTIIQGLQYKASISFSNDQNTDMIPLTIGIDDITGGGAINVAKKDYSLFQGQTMTDVITFTAPVTSVGSRTYQLKTDYYDTFSETSETDNTATDVVTSQKTDLMPTSITILDARDSSTVSTLIQGHNYIARVVVKNNGTTNVGAFSVGLTGNQGLSFTAKSVASLNAGISSTSDFTFTATNAGTYSFTATADNTNAIAETDETNNTISTSIVSYTVNLTATSIDIVGVSDTTNKAQLQQNKQYRAAITVTNSGQTNITTPFTVALNENTVAKGTATVNSLNAGASTVVYVTFTEINRGSVTFQGVVDSTNVIDETNESDNSVSTVRTAYRLNIKTTSIDVVGTSDTVSKNPLTQNLSYRAAITVTNDGDNNITTPFVVGFYDNTSTSTKLGTTNVTFLNAGASTTVYINYTPNTVGLRTLVGIADDGSVIDESDETDNSASVQKTVNRVNIQAVSINVVDGSGTTQTNLQKGLTYYAKVTLTNNSSIALGAFNLGIYDNGDRIALLPIASMVLNATNVVYTVAFVPNNTGTRTLSAWADDNAQIAESDETDNQVAMTISVVDLQLQNFRIISMVNPPSVYTYPITVPSMPTIVKSGYNVVFQVDVIGMADSINANIYNNNTSASMGTVAFTKVVDIDATHSTWQYTWATPLNTPNGTIISTGIVGVRNAYNCNYNINNSWNNGTVVNTGKTLLINGSALDDVMINRIY